jgi:hypothetical protein
MSLLTQAGLWWCISAEEIKQMGKKYPFEIMIDCEDFSLKEAEKVLLAFLNLDQTHITSKYGKTLRITLANFKVNVYLLDFCSITKDG